MLHVQQDDDVVKVLFAHAAAVIYVRRMKYYCRMEVYGKLIHHLKAEFFEAMMHILRLRILCRTVASSALVTAPRMTVRSILSENGIIDMNTTEPLSTLPANGVTKLSNECNICNNSTGATATAAKCTHTHSCGQHGNLHSHGEKSKSDELSEVSDEDMLNVCEALATFSIICPSTLREYIVRGAIPDSSSNSNDILVGSAAPGARSKSNQENHRGSDPNERTNLTEWWPMYSSSLGRIIISFK